MSPLANRMLALLAALMLAAACTAQEAYLLQPLDAERSVVAQGAYFPRLLALPGGELLAAFKYGAAHIGKSGKAGVAGRTWSAPQTVFDVLDADDGIIASGILRDGTLLLGAVSYTWRGEKYSMDGWKADAYILRSRDRGRSWRAPPKVNVSPLTWAYPFGRIVELPDGVLLLSGYGGYLPRAGEDTKSEAPRGYFCFVTRSRDGDATWGDLTIIARRHNEVALLALKTGELLTVMRSQAVMRSQEEGQHLAATISSDGGYHWSWPSRITGDNEHPGDQKSPMIGHPADLIHLAGGRILCTYGSRPGTHSEPGGIRATLSADNGETWLADQEIRIRNDFFNHDIGYPESLQLPDGRVLTVYYFNLFWPLLHWQYFPEAVSGTVLLVLLALQPQIAENPLARQRAYKSYEFSRVGDLVQAEQEMRAALQLAPQNPLYSSGLGGILVRQGKREEAKACFEKALQLDPNNQVLRSHLATITLDLGRADEAVRLLEAGLKLTPADQDTYLELGALLGRARRYHAGLAVATTAASRFGESARTQQMLGFFQMKLQQNVAAAASYARALSLDPESAAVSVELGIAQFAAGMNAEAIRTFEAGIRKFPKHAIHYQAYGVLLAKLAESGQAPLPQAVAMLQAALRLDPSLAESHYQLGRIALSHDNLPEACEHLERAARQSEPDSRVHFALSRLYRRMGRSGDAAAQLERYRVLKQTALPVE